MGAGQIGGIATLVDMDFGNPATFLGERAEATEGQYIVYYLSHAMMFCLGSLIEAHVILTPASCVYGERYKFNVVGGSHRFLEHTGKSRQVQHLCIHKGYNATLRWTDCFADNVALLVLTQQFSLNHREENTEFMMNRVRYGGAESPKDDTVYADASCKYYGYGSRRNGFLIPLLIHLRRMDVTLLPKNKCLAMFNFNSKYLCIQQGHCKNEKFGALCPDDVGSLIVCSGYALGMMTTRLVDRPCGVGFIDLTKYTKFLTCGVDDSRDVLLNEMPMDFDYATTPYVTPSLLTTVHEQGRAVRKN